MPNAPRKSAHHKKRHGHHQKRTGAFLKTYHPFMPLLLIVTGSLLVISALSSPRPSTTNPGARGQEPAVLAYATSISSNGLLTATNQRRTAANVGALTINSKLTQAAQAKANDMATRNYWAHNTPDGTPPWSFITNAGYSYNKAGENLACGFDESSDVVLEWYNSPSHRDNLIHPDYTEVGFGMANAESYNCGSLAATNQTIIVAMYGKPYSSSSSTSPTSTPSTTPKTITKPRAVTSPTVPAQTTPTASKTITVTFNIVDSSGKPVSGVKVILRSSPRIAYTDKNGNVTFSEVPAEAHTVTVETNGASSVTPIDLTNASADYKLSIVKPILTSNKTDSQVVAQPRSVNRLQTLTNQYAGWVFSFLMLAVILGVGYLLFKHSRAAHKFIVKGEKYIVSHWYVDILVIILGIILYFLTRGVASVL